MGEQLLRIVILGCGAVGKSALVIRYALGQFIEQYDPTIEDCHRKQVTLDGLTSVLDIVDTAGQEEFALMADQWYQTGHGFLLVYSIADRKSLEEAIERRNKAARVRGRSDFPAVLLANKADLESGREIGRDVGEKTAAELGMPFFEASARTGQNVAEAFTALVRLVRTSLAAITPAKPKRACVLL